MNHFNKGAVGLSCACLTTRMTGEPYSGNLYLRFDEDLGRKTPEITLLGKLPAELFLSGWDFPANPREAG